jgi:hypothetical protein
MNLPNLPVGSDSKIMQLISEAPGNFFSLDANGTAVLPAKFYKDCRPEFLTRINTYLNSDLSAEGVYTINNGTTRKVRPIFYIQKGTAQMPATISLKEDKSNLELVKENAELKAKLNYLQLQFNDLSEALEETEADLADAPEQTTQPNPWFALAESLAPVAGQILAAMATKYLTPNENEQQNRTRPSGASVVAIRYPRGNAESSADQVQNQQPNYTDNLQGDDNSGAAVRDFGT